MRNGPYSFLSLLLLSLSFVSGVAIASSATEAGLSSQPLINTVTEKTVEPATISAPKTGVTNSKPIGVVTTAYRPAPESQAQLLKVMLALAGVLALILGLAWLFKQFVQPMAQATQKIKIISSLSLGNKEKLVLTEVNGQQILLGVTAQSVSALKTFDRNEIDDAELQASSADTMLPGQDFKSKISQLMKPQ